MNREIKFRGWFQGINGQEYWAYGYLVKQANGNWELTDGETFWTVDNVGQYTGLIDSKTKEPIYEDDIILYDNRLGVIKWTGHGFNGVYTNGDGSWDDEWEDGISDYGKIYKRGNIFENPELLKDED